VTTRRQFLGAAPAAGVAFAIGGGFLFEGGTAHAQAAPLAGHVHPQRKAPSQVPMEVLTRAKAEPPFDDRRDFDEWRKGLIAEVPSQDVLRAHRDMYANLNNQALHLANQGVTINQVHNVYEMPKNLQEKWY
jgi:alkyl sulfatase BDS1-like metallo-beta-lactamase superfamily hydrolase